MSKTSSLRAVLALVALSATLSAPGAKAAETYPVKPIVVIVPAPRGGGTDFYARELAKIVEEDLKQAIIIDNKPRGSGTDGITKAVNAAADGYTLAFVWNSPLTAIPLAKHVAYMQASYKAVMSVGFSSYVLCTRPEFAANNASEFLKELVSRPNVYKFGNDGIGGTMHLAAERIFQRVGAKVEAVPYVGSTDTVRNFLSGQVSIYGGSLSAILPHVKDKVAKCLLLTSASGNPALPATEGLESVGLADSETVLWWGLIAPGGTPSAIIERLEQAFKRAASTDRFKQAMAAQGATLRIRGSAETTALITSEAQALKLVADKLGLSQPQALH
jgi:tripartite-type tricarboxylate transporter receptor subunit TctC